MTLLREPPIEHSGGLTGAIRAVRKLGSGDMAKSSVVSLLIRIAGLSLSFAQAVLTARLLGAAGYGIVAVAISIVQMLATFCVFGFGGLAVREISARIAQEDRAGIAAFLRSAAIVVLLVSTLAGFGLALLPSWSELIRPTYRTVIEAGGLAVVPLALIILFRGIAQGFGQIVLAQAPGELLRPFVMIMVMGFVAIVGLRFGPVDFMWSAVAAALVAALAAGGSLWVRRISALPAPRNGAEVHRHMIAALTFLGLDLTSILQGEINTVLLGSLASARDAGLFQPILRLTFVLTMAAQAAAMRYAPSIAELWKKGERSRIRSVTAAFTWTTSLITFGVALGIAVAGPWLMWLFGPAFRQTAPLLWIVAAAQIFNAACGPVGYLLTMSGAGGRALAGQLAGLCANVALGVLLIPAYGVSGAVIATAVGIVVWNVTMLSMVRMRYGFDPSLVSSLSMRIVQ